MSSDEGRRSIKIVEESRAEEISGGIKNALNRGESLIKAKQSFVNAGYSVQEVEEASRMTSPQPQKLTATPLPQTMMPMQPQNKSISNKTIIIIAVAGAVIITAALLLGLFWNKL